MSDLSIEGRGEGQLLCFVSAVTGCCVLDKIWLDLLAWEARQRFLCLDRVKGP